LLIFFPVEFLCGTFAQAKNNADNMVEEKRYCFDYITETVNGWLNDGRKITLQQMLVNYP
jgi:hypothetical protein